MGSHEKIIHTIRGYLLTHELAAGLLVGVQVTTITLTQAVRVAKVRHRGTVTIITLTLAVWVARMECRVTAGRISREKVPKMRTMQRMVVQRN